MPLESGRASRIAAYFGRAAGRHGYLGSDRNALVREMLALLERLEADNPPELAGWNEQQILSMVATSVLGKDQRDRSGRTRSLGSEDFARGDDDPAIIVDREERGAILGAALGQAIGDLTEQQRTLVVDVYWKGLSQAEVARSQERPRQRVHDDLNAIIGILAGKMGHLRDLHVSS
jgi:DNA-directed RNA polymerase specialized sigma24 family protein